MWKNLIQIAGVKNLEEAETLISKGVKFIGFPLRLTVNAEDTTEEEAKSIIETIKSRSVPVLITYLSRASEIDEFCKFLDVSVVQLHGEIELAELEKLKRVNPELQIIKSLVIRENNFSTLVKTVQTLNPLADAFITDTFDPETGAEGATGKTHDWDLSKKLVELSGKPVILAGGLTPENVFDAIMHVRPAGVDSHTGVEDVYGNKDAEKIERFVSEAKRAFKRIAKQAN